MKLRTILLLTFISTTFHFGCIPPPPASNSAARAPTTEEKLDQVMKRVDSLEKIVNRWSDSIKSMEKGQQQYQADHSVLMDDLDAQLKNVKGMLELIRHDLDDSLKNSQRLHEDLDRRLLELESKPQSALPAESPKPIAKNRTDDAINRYNQILRLVLEKKEYDSAIRQFESFVKEQSGTSLAGNAQYWIGEAHFAKGDFARSIAEFQKVVDQYPKSEKVCDARLKQGFAFSEMKDQEKAKLFLQEVVRKCPNTKTSARASTKLRQIEGAKNG